LFLWSTIIGDGGRLRQVLLNLIGNALKFTERGSVALEVAVEGQQADECRLCFVVRDTGIGIPANRLEAIFAPFDQMDSSTARRYGGTGLGLPIACRLAGLLGGQVRAQSVLGQGSTFSFTACLRRAHRAERSVADRDEGTGRAAGGPTTPRLRILLADDNEVNQRLGVGLLEQQGHEIHVVGTGQDALTALASGPPFDVVLMDVQMPDMDGLQAVAALRRQEAGTGRRVPVIAVTAHAMQGDRERCLAAGMDGYVTKPISGATLARAIAAARGRPSAVPPVEDQPQLPGPAATAGRDAALDAPALLRRLGGNRALLAQVVQLFRTDGTRRMSELAEAAACQDWARLSRESHTLKGTRETDRTPVPDHGFHDEIRGDDRLRPRHDQASVERKTIENLDRRASLNDQAFDDVEAIQLRTAIGNRGQVPTGRGRWTAHPPVVIQCPTALQDGAYGPDRRRLRGAPSDQFAVDSCGPELAQVLRSTTSSAGPGAGRSGGNAAGRSSGRPAPPTPRSVRPAPSARHDGYPFAGAKLPCGGLIGKSARKGVRQLETCRFDPAHCDG
jgi:CheY-like chemotaxis protein